MLLFTRFGNTTLYKGAPQDSSSGHHGEVLLILPAQIPVPPATMTLEEAWEFQNATYGAGYILFAPPDAGFGTLSEALANRLHELMPRFVRNHHLSLGWVSGNAGNLASLRLQTLTMVRAGDVVRTQNLPQIIRFQQIEIMFLPAVPVTLGPNGFVLENTEYLAPPGSDPNVELPTHYRIYMRSAAPRDIDKVGETVEVPLLGGNRGSLSFDVNDLIADEIDAGVLDAAIYYVAPDQERGRDQSLRYPLFNLADPKTGESTVSLRAVLFAANQMNSRFEIRRNGDGTPRLRSNFGTYDGHPIYFIPSDGASLVFAHVPNPGVHPSRAAEVETHYALVPSGYFELAVDPEGDTGGMVWLRGGSSGNEFISFMPRRGSTPGDVMAFFPGQNGYGPDRFDLSRRLEQVVPGDDLLTSDYRTSWATVSPHPASPNGHINQYYAQPDDNVLHAPNGGQFLESVEVAASDLLPLTGTSQDAVLTFPIAPLSGVFAPDPRVAAEFDMSKYVVFEKEIMSPTRKNRISANAPSGKATVTSRRLFQTGTQETTTPQGMIVDLDGTDWKRMTLAYDGVNHLRIQDVSDELQNALNTNELFLVITQPGLVEESPVTDPENLIEITGWPFRLEVGQNPYGLPAGSGLDRYNNVLIFKFKQGKFEDLITDTSQWASPATFNDDLDDVQEWLSEIIEDAKEKAEDVNSEELYSSLVEDVLTDPDWTGVLAFNVTVPLAEMPCEVQGLLGGMRDFSAFKAHHLGFRISKVTAGTGGALEMDQSSIFGLIDYDDDAGLSNPRVDYEYYVSTLKVRFANTEIADFSSTVDLGIMRAFDEKIRPAFTDPQSGKVTIDSVQLEGTYQTFDGVPTYTFEVIAEHDPFEFIPTNNVPPLIHYMYITKVQFLTSACVDPAKLVADPDMKVQSEFRFWGSLGFRINLDFDFFSFDKLPFTDMIIGMSFGFDTNGIPVLPTSDDFYFDSGNLRVDVSGSKPREDSLFSNFPIRLNSFHYAPQELDITQLGYWHVPNMIPGWGEADRPQYALAFTIDVGPLTGAYAKKRVNLAIEIIAAWAPSERSGGATFGLKLGQSSDGNREFSIEGVFAIGVENFGFLKLPERPADGEGFLYAFFIKSAYIKIMKQQIPPGGTFSFLLFVPYSGTGEVDLKAIGGYASYNGSGGGGGGSSHMFDIKVNAPEVPNSTIQVDQKIDVKVKVENTSTAPTGVVKVVVLLEAESDEYLTRHPTPYRHTVELDHAQNKEKEVTFSWSAGVPGDYTLVAKIEAIGVLTPDNLRAETSIKVQYSDAKKDKPTKLKVDFLGVGWRVGMPEGNLQLLQINTIEDVFEALNDQMLPNKNGDALREHLEQVYNPEYGLTVGVDLTILEVIRIAFLFAQPNNLYGALIGFVDKAPKPLKGFQFQILYKKLSDDLGVYQMQLKIPDAIRQFELGAASITIPVIGIDIFTNGDFKLNFGFPAGGNWGNSFAVQMMAGPVPIQGFVGFYFNKLSGATSTKAPAWKSGSEHTWNPVLEFGIGFKIGLGKSIEKGPLRAGLSVAIMVILEGTLAWHRLPGDTSSSVGNAPDWYKVKGQAGLAAEIYGVLDFGIIKLGLEVSASAVFLFTFESYADTEIGVQMSLSVRVTIIIGSFKIFGKRINITISFSFSATFSFKFTIKNTQPRPSWNDELENPYPPLLHALDRGLLQADSAVSWNAFKTTATNTVLPLYFSPQVTAAGEGSSRRTYVVAGLSISTTEFNKLAEALTAWAVGLQKGQSTYDGSATVTLADLEALNDRFSVTRTLATPAGGGATPLDYQAIMSFLSANYSSISILETPMEGDGQPITAVAFPMVPEAQVHTVGQQGGEVTIDFGTYNPRSNGYEEDLADYFDALLVDVEYKSGIEGIANRILDQAYDDGPSMATHVFQDYFAFLVKAGVDRAIEYAQNQGEGWSSTISGLMSAMASDFTVVGQMATRTFFSGLRLPPNFLSDDMIALSNSAVPLYELTGQQFPLNLQPLVVPEAEDEEEDPDPPYYPEWSMILSKRTGGHSLVTFSPVTMSVAEQVMDEEDEALDEDRANIALVATTNPYIGTLTGPSRINPIKSEFRRFSFANPLHLDRKSGTSANGDTFTRVATTYPFSEALMDRLRDGVPAGPHTLHNPDGTSPVTTYTWALRIQFSAKQVERPVDPNADPDDTASDVAQFIPNTYMIGGTDERTRDLIDKLLSAQSDSISGLRLYYEVDAKVNGIVGDNLGASPDVLIMKTNLSTVSAPQTGLQQVVHPAADEFSAAMTTGQAREFLRLLWEASIVNSPGYYLYYDNGAEENNGLPDEAFQGRSNFAPMSLYVTFDSLRPYANTLIIDMANFEEGSDLYLQTGDLVYLPSVAPGAVGFTLQRPNPESAGMSIATDLGSKFNLLSYNIIENDHFRQSMRGLPVGPSTEDPDDPSKPWVYRQGIRVYPFSKDVPAGSQPNIYAGTNKPFSLQLEFLDIFGNLLPSPRPMLSDVRVKYTDSIIGVSQWPGVATGYEFTGSGGTGTLVATVSFAAEAFPINGGNVPAAIEAYLLAREQLNGPGVSATLRSTIAPNRSVDIKSALNGFIDDVLDYLRGTGAAPSVLTLQLTNITESDRNVNTRHTFEVETTISIARDRDMVESPDNMPDSQNATTIVPPEPITRPPQDVEPPPAGNYTDGQKIALEDFARAFETAFPELRAATGNGKSGPRTIWAVRLAFVSGSTGLRAVVNGTPAFFAPAPLSTTLMTRADIPMKLGPTSDPDTPVTVTNVDMDELGREFFAEVDRLLGPMMAPAARKVNPDAYLRLLEAKQKLADGVSSGVTNVLVQDENKPEALAAAREAYRQSILTQLSSAYDIETAVVFPMSTTNNADLARLYGSVAGKSGSMDDFGFSPAKVDITGGASQLPFLVDADRARDQASIYVDVNYRVSHIEHDIDLPSEGGYEASSWLNFIIQDKSLDLGVIDIPIPLREFPTPPALIDQQALPVDIDTVSTLADATEWEYFYTFHQSVVAQDSVFADVVFNVGPEGLRNLLQGGEDLLDCLARFHHEYPYFKNDLAPLSKGYKVMSSSERSIASSALNRFASLAEDIADTWGDWIINTTSRRLNQGALERYSWDFGYIERRESGSMITVEITKHASTGDQPQRFPRLQVTLEDGTVYSPPRTENGNSAIYQFEWNGELPATRQRTLSWDDLDVLHTENAWGGIRLSRNLSLSRIGTHRPTNPRFIYETQQVRFVNKVTPLIDNKRPIDITGGDTTPRSLNQHLANLLRELFEPALNQANPNPRLIKIGVRYAYDVRGQSGPAIGPAQVPEDPGFYEFQAFLPVTQILPFELKPTVGELDAFAGSLASQMNSWMASVNPSRARGFYELDLAIFAALSATDLPVLRLRRLWLGLDKIS